MSGSPYQLNALWASHDLCYKSGCLQARSVTVRARVGFVTVRLAPNCENMRMVTSPTLNLDRLQCRLPTALLKGMKDFLRGTIVHSSNYV